MEEPRQKEEFPVNKKSCYGAVAAAVLLMGVLGLTIRVFALKPDEATKTVPIPQGEYDPTVWGKVYPLQYEKFRKTLEMAASPTGYGGSVKFQHSDKQPEILVNFKGMAFSKDYTEDRGHPYALEDLRETKRITAQSPGACMTCKSANLIDIYRDKGWSYAKTPLGELFPRIKHSITCANCHDPATMKLKIANPAFLEAMERRGIDVAKASRNDMRSYVCAQCHVEYYFEPGTSRVILPWDKGLQPEEIYTYYSEKPRGFEQDWIQPDSQAKMLKAQHPEFETWSGGTHAKAGAGCPDCHMPYVRHKGQKYTSHWVTSPMRTVESSCTPCHDQAPDWLRERVKGIQDSVWQAQRRAGTLVAQAHEAIGKASTSQKTDAGQLDKARESVRKAQWYWDMVAAENSVGFHNPTQTLRVLARSIDAAHEAILTAERAGKRTP